MTLIVMGDVGSIAEVHKFLFSLGKPRPQGESKIPSSAGVRVNWLCLEISPNGVLYWSIGVLILKTKKRWLELSEFLEVLFLLKKNIT